MPYDYKKAIDELCRVAKKVVVLFEPSYELGSFSQKIKMKAQDYVKGIPRYINSKKGATLLKHSFLQNSSLFNRTASHVVMINAPLEESNFYYVCPSCKHKFE